MTPEGTMGEVTEYLKPHIYLHSQPQQSQGVIAVSILAPSYVLKPLV
jgi:hypothetical protein